MKDRGRPQSAIVSQADLTLSTDARVQRYRQAERAWWAHHGLDPTERFIDLGSPAVRLRVLEIGSGQPVLFIHGSAGAGPVWAPLVRELNGVRCLMLDRPGWGLSSPIDYARYEYKALVANILRGVLDALGVDRTHLIGGSIGNVWALRLAAQHPSLVDRIILIGGGPLLPELPVPRIVRLLASPIGAIMVRLPETPRFVRGQLRQLGHGASLDTGRTLDAFVRWRVGLMRHTDSARHERAMIRAVASWRGFRPGLTFEDRELAAIGQPTLHIYGTADPAGTVDIARRAVGLLPQAELHLVEDGGHVPWLDNPSQVGGNVSRHLAGASTHQRQRASRLRVGVETGSAVRPHRGFRSED
jgi:pimeloyl-ACP methyl ester carboxylesterase